jgi:hypothetical protein
MRYGPYNLPEILGRDTWDYIFGINFDAAMQADREELALEREKAAFREQILLEHATRRWPFTACIRQSQFMLGCIDETMHAIYKNMFRRVLRMRRLMSLL